MGEQGSPEVIAGWHTNLNEGVLYYNTSPMLDWHTVISSLTVTVILLLVAALGMRKTDKIPRGTQALFEHIFNWLDGLAQGMMGPIGRRYVPFVMALFLYILLSNWLGLIPNVVGWMEMDKHHFEAWHLDYLAAILEPPTKNVEVTLALAIISFVAFMVLGIHRSIERATAPAGTSGHGASEHDHAGHGHDAAHAQPSGGVFGGLMNWLGHYIQPTPSLWQSMEGPMKVLVVALFFLFLFLNIVEEVARVVSLTFRLYGNIFGEHTVKEQFLILITSSWNTAMQAFTPGGAGAFAGLFSLVLILIFWASTLFVLCLGTLVGFIQALVFALLTLSYIAHAVADQH